MSDQLARDRQVVLVHCANKGIQMFALLTPAIALPLAFYRRTFSLARFLRTSALSTFVGGPAFGLAAGYGRMSQFKDTDVARETGDRAERIEANWLQTRCDDYSKIGGVLGGLATTLVLLRRAPLLWTVAGGASLGVAGGVLAHVLKNKQEGTSTGVDRMVDEVKAAAGK